MTTIFNGAGMTKNRMMTGYSTKGGNEMKNVKRKLALASIMLCGGVALGFGALNNASVTVAADNVDGFKVKSAALRVPDAEYGAGIRFTIGMGNAELAEGATMGVLLIPTSSLGDSALTLGLNNADLRTYSDLQWKTLEDGTKEAYLHLYDVPAMQYTSNISICAYIDNDADPATDPIYTDVVSASVAEVADWAYCNDTTLDEEAKATLQATYLTYKVFYHNEDDVTEATGIYNQTLTAVAEPVKVGYTFDGWWNQAGTHEWDFATTKVSSTTTNLYAKWAPASDTAYSVKVFETTDGGKTQTEISVADFEANRTGTTGADLDITAEANAVVTKLGKGYTLNTEKSVLTGVISADGTTELKIVVNFDEFALARVGEDANTLLFFDRELGVKQVTGATGNSYGFVTDKKYGNEEGSLRITFPNTGDHNTADLDFKGYEFGEDDYIEFYVYNDTTTPTLSLMFGYSNSTQLIQGEWTRVVGSASWITTNKYFRFYGQAANFGSGTNVDGSVYISKVKVYSGFEDLSAATGDWTIGETTFTGAAVINNNAPASHLQKTLYQTGDVVTMRLWSHSYAGFEATFKTNIDATSEDKYVSFTAKGADADLFTVVMFNASGSAFTGATKACVTRMEANGYTTYVFRIAKGNTVSKFRITPLGNTTETGNGSELIISNCMIGDYSSLRTGEDANTVFFTDSQLGATLQQVYTKTSNNVASSGYTTEMAYGNERGSFKAAGIKHGTVAYHNLTWTDADKNFLGDDDYVVFYIYSTSSTRWVFSLNYDWTNTGWEIMPNAWNRIIISGKAFKAGTWTHIHPAGQSADGKTFDVYMSKVVRYSAEDVQRLENKGTTDTWTLGSTTFVGAPNISNGSTSTNYLAGVEHKKAYIVDDELSITFVRCSDGYINLKLAESIEVAANTETYVTVTMFNYGRLDKLNGYLNSSGSYALSYVSHEDIGDGYAKVVFKCSAKDSAYTITSVRLDVEDHTDSTMATQLRIKDIAITTKQA